MKLSSGKPFTNNGIAVSVGTGVNVWVGLGVFRTVKGALSCFVTVEEGIICWVAVKSPSFEVTIDGAVKVTKLLDFSWVGEECKIEGVVGKSKSSEFDDSAVGVTVTIKGKGAACFGLSHPINKSKTAVKSNDKFFPEL